MRNDRPGLIAYLKEEVAYREQQLAQARAALKAAQVEAVKVNSERENGKEEESLPEGIRWTAETISIFREAESGRELSVDAVCDRLTAKGIPAHSTKARNNVQTAMARSVGKTLKRVRPGVYMLIEDHPSNTTIDAGACNEAESHGKSNFDWTKVGNDTGPAVTGPV